MKSIAIPKGFRVTPEQFERLAEVEQPIGSLKELERHFLGKICSARN